MLSELPRAAAEFGLLLGASPWLSLAPRGDGHGVLVLPGLGGGDESTRVLRRFLGQQGYDARPWDLGRNLGVRRMGNYDALLARVHEVARETGGKVSLVGWSLGGVHARAIAQIAPGRVRQVISLGSPIGGGRSEAHRELPVNLPRTAVYSRSDGVVPWRFAREPQAPQTDNIEVYSSHFGLGVNPTVLYAVADKLARPEGSLERFQRTGWKVALYGPATPHATEWSPNPI
jgi:pimeloyl-ACP methyl ester carboxylesterase